MIRQVWAMFRDGFDEMLARLDKPLSAYMPDADPEAMDAIYAARGASTRSGRVAAVPIYGTLTRRDTLLTQLFGGTSTNYITRQVEGYAADDSVSTILLLVDSPGGEAAGITEAAAAIRAARGKKKVVTLASGAMGSAAAWLGWSAGEVIAAPDALVGSQGIFIPHVDTSEAFAKEGIKVTYIASSDAKAGGRPGLPLSDESRAEMQAVVDEMDRIFVSDVAQGRGITPAQVKSQYGDGLVFHAREAKKRGMVDRVASYGETMARLSGQMRAEDDIEVAADTADEYSMVYSGPVTVEMNPPEPLDLSDPTPEPEPNPYADVTRAFNWRRITR